MRIRSVRTRRVRGVALLALAFAISTAASAAAQTVDIYDVDHVVVGWDPATGPVTGYHVVAERNGTAEYVGSIAAGSTLQALISGTEGDQIRVLVLAYDPDGALGPPSAYSPTYRFVSTPTSTPTPTPDPAPTPDPNPTPTPDPTPTPTPDPLPTQHADLDFNGDGTSDFLLRDPTGLLEIWNMDGSVVLSTTTLDPLPANWKIVGNGDYDGNGMADIVWQDPDSHRITIWLLDAGRIIREVAPRVGNAPASEAWKVGGSGDLDGDGDDELVLYSTVLGRSEVFDIDAQGAVSNRSLPGYVGSWSIDDVGDYDGDGVAEVAWRDERRHNLLMWDLDGAGAGAPRVISDSVKGWHLVGSGDFDGNGTDDLFMVRREPDKVEVWLLDGSTITGIVSLPVKEDVAWVARSVGDHDRDGLADLAWSNLLTGALEIWFSNGASITSVDVSSNLGGTASVGSATVVSGTSGSDDSVYRRALCNGDFNYDGLVDWLDASLLTECLGTKALGSCAQMDMNSDRRVDENDVLQFNVVLQTGTACVQ